MKKNKISFLKFSSEVGIGLPNHIMQQSRHGSKPYLLYGGDGKIVLWDNFPQFLAQIAAESPTHGAAIERKAFMILGLGIETSGLTEETLQILSEVNEDGESFDDLLEKISYDVALYEGFSLKIHYKADGSIHQIHHIPFQNVRKGVPVNGKIEYVVVSNNFDSKQNFQYEMTYSLPLFNPSIFENGNAETKLANAEQILYVQKYKPSTGGAADFYSVPSYICGMDAILTEKEIGIYNKAGLDNGFGQKVIIDLPVMPPDDESKMDIYNSIKSNFTAAKNNGGFILTFSEGGTDENRPKYEQIEAVDADIYLNVDANIKQSIVTAHQIPAILLEYNQGGGFNNRAEEMEVAFEQYQQTKIASYQSFILKKLSKVFGLLGIEESIKIKPFTLTAVGVETLQNVVNTATSDKNIQENNI